MHGIGEKNVHKPQHYKTDEFGPQDPSYLENLPERVVAEVEGSNADGSDRTTVVFDLRGPEAPVPVFQDDVYEAGELVRK